MDTDRNQANQSVLKSSEANFVNNSREEGKANDLAFSVPMAGHENDPLEKEIVDVMSKDSSLQAINVNESAHLKSMRGNDLIMTMDQKNLKKDEVVNDISEQVLRLDLKDN